MATTVASAFAEFLTNISLKSVHQEIQIARRDHLVELLGKSFDIIEAFPSGSIPRFTGLRQYADLDIMVVLHYSKHIKDKKPSEVLNDVRTALSKYKTNVRRNGQAVTLSYQKWPNVDIVPVSRSVDNNKKITHYNVPDMNQEEWLVSRPKTHSLNLTDRNKMCGQKFKQVIRMIKQWNHAHSEYLQSYHIEALALKAINEPLDDYSWTIYQFFETASSLIDQPLLYNGGYVDEYLSPSNRQAAKQRLETAKRKGLTGMVLNI